MTTAAWLVFVVALLFLLVAIRTKPEIGDQIDERIKSFLIIVFVSLAGLALIYSIVRFVRWAWYN